MQQKLLPYVLRSPFCIVLKVGCASAKKWECKRGYRGVYRLLPKNPKNFHPAAPPFLNQLQLFTHFTYDDETSFIGFALTSSIGSCKQISSTCENCDAAPCSRSGGLPRRN